MLSAPNFKPMVAPLNGLVLSGGASTRMKTDKARLLVNGQTWLARAVELVTPVTGDTFVSIRGSQVDDPLRKAFKTLIDLPVDAHQNTSVHSPDVSEPKPIQGPLAGILTALHAQPECAWLVIAVDLPYLDASTLQFLIAQRDPSQLATAFISEHDQLPEPLCAIYEPAAYQALLAFSRSGKHCPRKFLINHTVKLIKQPRIGALNNINFSSEWPSHQAREQIL